MKIVNYGQRSNSIESFLKKYGIKSILEAKEFCLSHGVDCEKLSVAFNQSLLMTQLTHTPWVLVLQ